MNSLAIELPGGSKIQTANVSDDTLSVDLSDSRTIVVPLAWYPRLLHGSTEERNNWRLIGHGEGIHWPDLDEDISLKNIILGQPSGESQSSLQRWLKMRSTGDLNLRDMSEEYTKIDVYNINEGAQENCQLSEEDKSEILAILNQTRFSQRSNASSELRESDLDSIIRELEDEAKALCENGQITEGAKFSYPGNCHSLARKLHERRGWKIVHGYVVSSKNIGEPSLTLRSHAVVRDDSGNLIELTILFNTDSFSFIEHNTGRYGIDYTAKKSREEESTSSLLLLSETALAEDWDNPEEDAAWAHLQQVM
jgi:hypothetical protein